LSSTGSSLHDRCPGSFLATRPARIITTSSMGSLRSLSGWPAWRSPGLGQAREHTRNDLLPAGDDPPTPPPSPGSSDSSRIFVVWPPSRCTALQCSAPNVGRSSLVLPFSSRVSGACAPLSHRPPLPWHRSTTDRRVAYHRSNR